jgi:hypothetical protein
MDILTIHVTNQNAYSLLNELEKLHLIKVLKKENTTSGKLSDKFAGKLPVDAAKKLQDYIMQSRDKWDM